MRARENSIEFWPCFGKRIFDRSTIATAPVYMIGFDCWTMCRATFFWGIRADHRHPTKSTKFTDFSGKFHTFFAAGNGFHNPTKNMAFVPVIVSFSLIACLVVAF
jgi:hypothetical protein